MLTCNVFLVIIILSTLFLSTTGNDNLSINSEHGFASSFAAKNIIASDVKQGQGKLQKFITESFAEGCPFLYFNTSEKCFPDLKKSDLFDLYNLTEETEKYDLIAERENLRLFAETCSNNENISFMKVFGFFKECINYIYNLNEGQRCLIVLCFLCAILKYKGVCLRPIITIIWAILLGKPVKEVKVKSSQRKERVYTDLLTTPSQRTTLVQHDIAHDRHVNNDPSATESQCEEHVNTEENIGSPRDSHVNCDESINSSHDSRMDLSSSVDKLQTRTGSTQSIDPEPWECSDSWDSLSDESCDEEFPDEFFVFPYEAGNVGVMLGPGDWEKIETENSSQDSSTSDVGGTFSTGVKSGQGYDVASEVDSVASSHCYCYSPVPKESASCLSRSSDELPATVYDNSRNYKPFYALSNNEDSFDWYESETSESDIEALELENKLGNLPAGKINQMLSNGEENGSLPENITTLEQSVKNHAVALAIVAGAFVLPCIIAAKLSK